MTNFDIDKKNLVFALFFSLILSLIIGHIIFVNTSQVSFSDLPSYYSLDEYHLMYKMYFPIEMILGLVIFSFIASSPIFYMVLKNIKNDKRYLFYVVLPNALVFLIYIFDLISDTGFWTYPILVIFLMFSVFIFLLFYYFKIWKYRIRNRFSEKISNLKVTAKTASYFCFIMMIFVFLFSVLFIILWLFMLFNFDFKSDIYLPPIINLAIIMIFYAFVMFFFTGMTFYEQYRFINKGKFADYKPSAEIIRNMILDESQRIKVIIITFISTIILFILLILSNPDNHFNLRLEGFKIIIFSGFLSIIYFVSLSYVLGLNKKRIDENTALTNKNWSLFCFVSIVFYALTLVSVYFISDIWNYNEGLFVSFLYFSLIFLSLMVYLMKNAYQKI